MPEPYLPEEEWDAVPGEVREPFDPDSDPVVFMPVSEDETPYWPEPPELEEEEPLMPDFEEDGELPAARARPKAPANKPPAKRPGKREPPL